jgi:hypothetical protein
MITPHRRLKVNVAKKLAASIVAAAHQHLRLSSEPMNHGRQSAASAFFNNLLGVIRGFSLDFGFGCAALGYHPKAAS